MKCKITCNYILLFRYGPVAGIKELREKIANYFNESNRKFGVPVVNARRHLKLAQTWQIANWMNHTIVTEF